VLKKISIFLFCIFAVVSAEKTSQDYASFIAGVILIQENVQLGAQRQLEEYMRLKEITGVDVASVLNFIDSFKNKPEQWKAVNDFIMNSLNGQN